MGDAAASRTTNLGPKQDECTQDEQPMWPEKRSLHKGRSNAAPNQDPLMALERPISLRAKKKIEKYTDLK